MIEEGKQEIETSTDIVDMYADRILNIVRELVQAAREDERTNLVKQFVGQLGGSAKSVRIIRGEPRQRASTEEVERQMQEVIEAAKSLEAPEFSRADIAEKLPHIEPAQIGRHLRKLVASNRLKMKGKRRKAVYSFVGKSRKQTA